jgi:hypothetical protein
VELVDRPRAIVFCASASLWGFALWARPTEADLKRIVPLLALDVVPPRRRLHAERVAPPSRRPKMTTASEARSPLEVALLTGGGT